MGGRLSVAPESKRVPPVALALGLAGLLPVAAALLVVILSRAAGARASLRAELAALGELGYAALILSFLGGMWWGQASRAPDRPAPLVYVAAVVPTLVVVALFAAWTIAFPQNDAMMSLALGAAIIATLPIDALLVRRKLAPGWWMQLRVPLSLGLGLGTMLVGVLVSR